MWEIFVIFKKMYLMGLGFICVSINELINKVINNKISL